MSAHFNLRAFAVLLSGAAASILSAPAAMAAQEAPVYVFGESQNVNVERVPYASLDLDTLSGRKALHHKVGGAIERVCEIDLGRDGLQDRGYYRCTANAWGDAASQIADAIASRREAALSGAPVAATAAIVVSAN